MHALWVESRRRPVTAQWGGDRPRVATTAIPGLLVVDLDLRRDHELRIRPA